MGVSLVMGANRGIGLELCRQLTARGERVVAVCRRSSDALEALDLQIEAGVDQCSEDQVASLAERLEGVALDLVLCNAGILTRESLDNLDFDAIRRQFEVNAMGPLRVASALLPRMSAGGKLAVVTSRMGSIGDNSSGGRYGYRMSKAAVNAAFVSLARDLHERGIAVAILHPGFVRTDMTRNNGLIDPPESTAGLLARIDALTLENSGTFWHANGEVLPW